MQTLLIGVFARIFSNSYLNVFQKLLTNSGERASVVNFYTYLGLVIIGFCIIGVPYYSAEMLPYILVMGLLGTLGNYFIIKALSCGELSLLAPVNSYKPIIAMILGIVFLNELPTMFGLFGIFLIIAGTVVLIGGRYVINKSFIYRFVALIFSGTEALFIKKVIIMSDISSAFIYWALSGLIFAFFVAMKSSLTIKKTNILTQILLIIMVAVMQYSTNYVFSKMNVSYALALFQLSTILSVFLGVNIFEEKGLIRKLSASAIMLIGACIIILFK